MAKKTTTVNRTHRVATLDAIIAIQKGILASSPRSNDKLNKDAQKVANRAAVHKYIFFYAPTDQGPVEAVEGVNIVRLETILVAPPLPSFHAGGELVDVADREALYEVMDGPELRRLYGTPDKE